MNENDISPLVRQTLERIETKDYDWGQLSTYYENTLKFTDITEYERELIVQALESKIRLKNPRKAKSLFGPKDAEARSLLQCIYERTASECDLSANRVGNGVKTGGDMIAGKAYVDVYISYKNEDKWHAGLGFYQTSAEAEPKLRVRLYQGRENNAEGREMNEYPVNDLETAAQKYTKHLERIIS